MVSIDIVSPGRTSSFFFVPLWLDLGPLKILSSLTRCDINWDDSHHHPLPLLPPTRWKPKFRKISSRELVAK